MIGGEFDLSAGCHGGDLRAVRRADHLPAVAEHVGRGAGCPCCVALAIGFVNGYLVVNTKIPSFLITLSHVLHAPRHQPRGHQGRHRHRGHRPTSRPLDGFLAAKAVFASRHPARVHQRQDHRAVVAAVRRHRDLDPAAHQGRQLDLRRRRQRRLRPRRRRPGAQGQDRPVHGRVVPGLVPRHAPAVQLLLGAVRARASATSSSTSSPRSSAAACSPAATARSSAPRSARSSSA